AVVQLLSAVPVSSKAYFTEPENQKQLHDVAKVLIRESKKVNKQYRRFAIDALGTLLDSFSGYIDYYQEAKPILFKILKPNADEDSDMDVDDEHAKPLQLMVLASAAKCLGLVWSVDAGVQSAESLELATQVLAEGVARNVWNVRNAFLESIIKYLTKLQLGGSQEQAKEILPPHVVCALVDGLIEGALRDFKYLGLRTLGLEVVKTLVGRLTDHKWLVTPEVAAKVEEALAILSNDPVPKIAEEAALMRGADMAAPNAIPSVATLDVLDASSASSILSNSPMSTWGNSNPRRFLGDDDRIREFSSFFSGYFDSSHPQHNPADAGTTQLIPLDKQQQADIFHRVATEFRHHCRSPDDFEIVKVELLRNKVLWKRYHAEKAVRRELEAEKYVQRQMARMAGKSGGTIVQQGNTVAATPPTSTATPSSSNPSYQAALKRQHEANHASSLSGSSQSAQTPKQPSSTAYFDAILFHGTKTSSLPSILENGLDPRTSSRSNYGRGLYFSDTVEKCMHYVDFQNSFDQVYSILLCCVVLGNVLVNPFDKEQRHVNTDTLFLPPGFDSVCEMNPLKEFVVFEKTQVLPLCVVSVKASNRPSSFWRICSPALHSYPWELRSAQTLVHVSAPVEQDTAPPVTQPTPRITQPLVVSTQSTPSGVGTPNAGGSLLAVFGAKPLTEVPPLDKLGVIWTDIIVQAELVTFGLLFNMRPREIKKATCYLYGVLYTLIAGIGTWNGMQLIVRIPPPLYDSLVADARERHRLEEQENIDRKARLTLEAVTENRLRAEFTKNPTMHQLYPVGKTILMDMDKIKQDIAAFPAARQAILDASTTQPAHITQFQLQEIQRQHESLLARQLMLLEDAKSFTLEQQQWIIAMVEEEAKLAQMRQNHINAGAAAQQRLKSLIQRGRERVASAVVVMSLDELAILVRIAENAKNTRAALSGTPSAPVISKSNGVGSTFSRQVFTCRMYTITCWEAEVWPQMLAEMIMSRVLISKIQPTAFQFLLSQTRKVNPEVAHPRAIPVAGSNGPPLVVAKNGWWYDAPRRHFQIPIATSRFWPVDPRSRLPNRSFQTLGDYLTWAVTKTEKRKLTLSRRLEANSRRPPHLAQTTPQLSVEETLSQLERRIQDGLDAIDSSVWYAISGLSAVSGRIVFARKQMEEFLEQHVASVVSSLYEPVLPEKIPKETECSVCLMALSTSQAPSSATSSTPFNKANGVVQLDAESRVVKLKCCRHCFHETCIASWFHAPSTILKCPVCSVSCQPTLGRRSAQHSTDSQDEGCNSTFPKIGPAPDGVMGYYFDPRICAYYIWFSMPGHDAWDSTNAAAPKRIHVPGENRYAIIPFSARLGPLLLIRMIVAFKFGHMFRVGRSLSRNIDNVITWNGIHCRTDLANRSGFGFPQPTYEANTWDELDQKRIAMSITPLLDSFLGPQKGKTALASSSPSTTTKATADTLAMTAIGIGPTAAHDDLFDGEDDREIERGKYDCEYEDGEEVESLKVSTPSAAATVTAGQPQTPTPPGHAFSVAQHPQEQQHREQDKPHEFWLDTNTNYFQDENRRDYDNMARAHSEKIEEAVHVRMNRGMPVGNAIEEVMLIVSGQNSTAAQENRDQDNERLAYKSHQGFFDPRCPLMFG
ncbi:putative E3 ubiquitin-protein ligase dtx2, partial [Actinomortierella ambigua]